MAGGDEANAGLVAQGRHYAIKLDAGQSEHHADAFQIELFDQGLAARHARLPGLRGHAGLRSVLGDAGLFISPTILSRSTAGRNGFCKKCQPVSSTSKPCGYEESNITRRSGRVFLSAAPRSGPLMPVICSLVTSRSIRPLWSSALWIASCPSEATISS